MENKIVHEDYPTYAMFFSATTKVGRKELLSKRWLNLPHWKKVDIYNKALSDKEKRNPDYYLNIGK